MNSNDKATRQTHVTKGLDIGERRGEVWRERRSGFGLSSYENLISLCQQASMGHMALRPNPKVKNLFIKSRQAEQRALSSSHGLNGSRQPM